MVTETKIVELVIVADHSEVSWPAPGCPPLTSASRATFLVTSLDPQVQRHRDFQSLLNRTLEVALLLDTVSIRPDSILMAPNLGNPSPESQFSSSSSGL